MKHKIQARIPNAMFFEIERAARHELVSIADFVRAALLEKLKRERDKNETGAATNRQSTRRAKETARSAANGRST
jgi:hypothetical protein